MTDNVIKIPAAAIEWQHDAPLAKFKKAAYALGEQSWNDIGLLKMNRIAVNNKREY